MKRLGNEILIVNFRVLPEIWAGGGGGGTGSKNQRMMLYQDNYAPVRDLNAGSSEYEV